MPRKIVLHAPTENALTRARGNARNALKAWPDAEIEIVVNADAVRLAVAGSDPETDPMLRICKNSLTAQAIECPGTIRTVSAAMTHIAERQANGWRYIRA
jgi:intracellular sulfur oxidation DsrE/DsrF family protein